jgi:cholesterol transport system auxiliary component
MRALRLPLALLLTASLAGCFGGKPPATLLTLTPLAGPAADPNRTARAGQSVTIDLPVAAKEIRVLRVPVLEAPGTVTYVKGLQYLDTPDRLFRLLLTETVKRTTNRVVLDPSQATLDPGLHVTGTLERFGYDTASGTVIVTYDAALSTAGGSQVETRRFTASAPSDGTPASVGPALNTAANDVAAQAAKWIGG